MGNSGSFKLSTGIALAGVLLVLIAAVLPGMSCDGSFCDDAESGLILREWFDEDFSFGVLLNFGAIGAVITAVAAGYAAFRGAGLLSLGAMCTALFAYHLWWMYQNFIQDSEVIGVGFGWIPAFLGAGMILAAGFLNMQENAAPPLPPAGPQYGAPPPQPWR